ncbi:MAG: hypothetical protein ABIP94_09615 [Planctomycetota bacterium]
MRRLVAISTLLLSANSLGDEAPAAAAGLCAAKETTYFQCTAGKGRSINLCGAPGGGVQYRFGRHRTVELAFPENAREGGRQLYYAQYFRARTDRQEIRFENHGVGYVLFDYREGSQHEAGVRVTGADGKERDVVCTGPVRSKLSALRGVLPCDAESALNGGRCP